MYLYDTIPVGNLGDLGFFFTKFQYPNCQKFLDELHVVDIEIKHRGYQQDDAVFSWFHSGFDFTRV